MAHGHAMTVLDASVMTAMIEEFPHDAREYPVMPLFTINGYAANEMFWDEIVTDRGMAKLTTLKGGASLVARESVKQGRAEPFTLFEGQYLDEEEVSILREPGAMTTERGARVIRAGLQQLDSRAMARIHWAMCTFLQGDNLTYTSNGLNLDIDFGLTAITAPSTKWDSASATAVQDIHKAKQEYTRNAGFPPDTVIWNSRLYAENLLANTEWTTYVKQVPGLVERILNGSTEPFTLFGMTWVDVQQQYAADSTGTLTDYWSKKNITFLNRSVPTGELEWMVRQDSKNNYTAAPAAWSKTDADGDHRGAIKLYYYHNGIPVSKRLNRVQTWRVIT